MKPRKQILRHLTILALLILAVTLVYYPGLHGPYVLDDEENITQNQAVAIHDLSFDSLARALASNESGPLKRPLAALSFAVNHYAAGGFDRSFPFKLVNLLIHLANAALLYGLTLLLLRAPVVAASIPSRHHPYLAATVAALWALHPLQLTTVLYVVQRMNGLSAIFVLAGLFLFCRGRQALTETPHRGIAMMYSGIASGTLLGVGAKENAALLPLFALVIEFTLFQRGTLALTARRQLRWFFFLCVAVPVAIFIGYLLTHPEFVANAYAERRFTPSERLMTQARVLWFYLSLILLPSTHRLGLFHDDIAVSTDLFSPITTLPAITILIAALMFSLWKAQRYPIMAFAILWFLIGHLLESSIFGLEIAYEHRNYLPSFGIIFGITMGMAILFQHIRIHETLWIAPSVAIAAVLAFSTFSRAYTWSDIHLLAEHSVHHHPGSPRSNDFAAHVELAYAHDPVRAINYVIQGLRAEPSEAGFYIDLRVLLELLSQQINATLAARDQTDAAQRNDMIVSGLSDSIRIITTPSGVEAIHDTSNTDTISELLRDQPITVHTIVSIEYLRRCIVEEPRQCRDLAANARDWLTVASKNPLTSPDYHALIFSNLAELYAYANNIERAYDYVTRASAIMPDEEFYYLGRIDYLIRLGRLDEAGELLAPYATAATKKSFKQPANLKMLQQLKKQYRLALEKQGLSRRGKQATSR